MSAILLAGGYTAIRTGKVGVHKAFMISAFAVSSAFLASYLAYHYRVGHVVFQGQGWIRPVYFTLLISHTILAIVVVPMVLVTLARALRSDFVKHRAIARWTYPIWLYVSVTGVLLSMAPVVVVLAENSPVLVPLFALPLAAVYKGVSASVKNTRLQELNQLKDDFVAMVSHELRTPLTSIQGSVKTLIQLGRDLDELRRDHYILLNPGELNRLSSTYYGIPPVPPQWAHSPSQGYSRTPPHRHRRGCSPLRRGPG